MKRLRAILLAPSLALAGCGGGRVRVLARWPIAGSSVPFGTDYEGTLRFDPTARTLIGTLSRDGNDVDVSAEKSAWTLTRQ